MFGPVEITTLSLYQVISGVGHPVTGHNKVSCEPKATETLSSCIVMIGAFSQSTSIKIQAYSQSNYLLH